MAPRISLHELYNMKSQKEKSRTLCYDRVVELCHRRIRTVAAYGGMNTFYEIPGMIVGYPLYNVHACCEYLMDHLRKVGFLVQILPPPHVAVVYISWDPQEIKPSKRTPTLPRPNQPPPAPPPPNNRLRLF